MPDDLGFGFNSCDMPYSGTYGYWSVQCNGVAYDPSYTYTPPIGYAISGTILLKDQIYTTPRLSNNVIFSPATCPSF